MPSILRGAVAALLLTFTPGLAKGQTPAREAVASVLEALAGDHPARAALVEDGFSPRMLEDAPASDWVGLLDGVAQASGGADIVLAKPGETERFGEYLIRARNAPRFAWLVLGVSRADPARISTLFLLPARDPEAVRRDAWPPARVAPGQLADEIGRRVDTLVREDAFSGAILVARGGDIVFERYAGSADRSAGALNGPDTRFNLASAGKMFTAAAIGRLLEEGRLSLDDTVGAWIPEYPDAAGRAITISQLLTHTSGLGDFFGPRYRANPRAFITATSYLPLIAAPPMFEPGSQFAYSNGGFALLGVIIERASGRDYFDFVRESVFDPAGMSGAGFPSLAEHDPRRAVGYFRAAGDVFALGERRSNEDAIAFRGNAAGGAYATARDMLAFSRALSSHVLLSPEITRLLMAPRVEFVGAPAPTQYGYGFATHPCGGRSFVGHGGGGPQSGVDATMLMTADWTIVVLGNYDPMPDDFALGLCEFLARQ